VSGLVRRWSWDDDVEPLHRCLARGGLLAIPTESSYGLAVDPRDERGVDAVFALKGRSRTKPLPVVVADLGQIRALGGDPSEAERSGLADLWPAALTLVLPLAAPLPAAAAGGSLGFRIPAHPRLRALLHRLGHGLTATSANRAGDPPLLDPRRLEPLLVRSDAVIVDDGVLAGGPPSTMLELAGGRVRLLRPGAFELAEGWLERLERTARRGAKPHGGGA
jgi:L-threonylcarbamoyladenylate synthase